MADEKEQTSLLVREVELPSRDHSGVAAILVAASALTLALAGSAFALWAKTSTHCHRHSHSSQPYHSQKATVSSPTDATAASATGVNCGFSTTTATYSLCTDRSTTVTPANHVLVEQHQGLVVFRIID